MANLELEGGGLLELEGGGTLETETDTPAIYLSAPSPLGSPSLEVLSAKTFIISAPSALGSPAAVVSLADAIRLSSLSPLGTPSVAILSAENFNLSAPSALGSPSVALMIAEAVRISVPTPLGEPALNTLNNFSALAEGRPQKYVMRVTGDPVVQIPISSWQATLQTDRESYTQCVAPAIPAYADILAERMGIEQFIIYRTVEIQGETLETEMARAELTTIIVQQGAFNETATISGYTNSFGATSSLAATELTGIRSTRQTLGGSTSIRSDIDWNLRPGQDVTGDGITFTTDYISYYVTKDGQAYMDSGAR